jgi:hypothetical protein
MIQRRAAVFLVSGYLTINNTLGIRFGVFAELKVEENLQGKEQLHPIENQQEETPLVVVRPVVALQIHQFGLHSVKNSSCEIADREDYEEKYDLLLLKLSALHSVVNMHPLETMDHADKEESEIVEPCDVVMRTI